MATKDTQMKKTLGLTGVTMNAMALIAPGAFLWTTFQLQAANTGGASDMWTGVVAALVIAFLTAMAFSEMARRYPEAGAGGSYYFAEKAFLDRDKAHHQRFARIAKFVTGWAAHLFYWVYPGVMVAFMGIVVTYIVGQFGIALTIPMQILVAVCFAILVGFIAVRGISGSTNVAIIINVIQLVSLVGFSALAIWFRLSNPLHATQWVHATGPSIVFPHSLAAMLFQSTIAILILVGFESSTSLAGETINPKRDIPRGVILSLVVQGIFAYLLEYFAANFAVCEKLTFTAADGTILTGMDAAAASGAPIGDMTIMIGNALLNGNGFALMIVIAFTVALAILGTTLAAMNTAVRVSFAMAQDNEMPELLGALHGKFATPHMGVWVLVAVSAIIGSIGIISVTALTGITLASNIGTFALYALICGLTFVTFVGRSEFHSVKHAVIPLLGLVGNVVMLLAILFIGLTTPGISSDATKIAIYITVGWGVVSALYLVVNSRKQGRKIIPSVSRIQA
ncbi:MAG TPA: APC family permease [Bacteroidota bacterium]|nr:APC family permease [Bacteroidota bacterium]